MAKPLSGTKAQKLGDKHRQRIFEILSAPPPVILIQGLDAIINSMNGQHQELKTPKMQELTDVWASPDFTYHEKEFRSLNNEKSVLNDMAAVLQIWAQKHCDYDLQLGYLAEDSMERNIMSIGPTAERKLNTVWIIANNTRTIFLGMVPKDPEPHSENQNVDEPHNKDKQQSKCDTTVDNPTVSSASEDDGDLHDTACSTTTDDVGSEEIQPAPKTAKYYIQRILELS